MTRWNRAKFWHDYVSLHGFMRCELCGWKRPCSSGYSAHHIISRHMTRVNKKARRYTEKMWYIFMASLCPAHNEIADDWETRHILLAKRVQLLGAAVVSKAIEELLKLMKSDVPELHRYLGE